MSELYKAAKAQGMPVNDYLAAQGNALVPYASREVTGITPERRRLNPLGDKYGWNFNPNFDVGDYQGDLAEGLRAHKGNYGYQFYDGNQRTDIQGNPYSAPRATTYGNVFDPQQLDRGGVKYDPYSGVGTNDYTKNLIAQEVQSHLAAKSDVSPQSAQGAAVDQINRLIGNEQTMSSNDKAWDAFYESQKKDRGFGSFMKNFARVALPVVAAPVGGMLAGQFLGAGATGVSAGGATAGGSGLGSSILSGFSAPQALGGAFTGGLGGLMSGGDLESALKGAAFGGLGGGFGSAIGSGLGLGQVGQQALTGALTGASGGLGAGNFKDAGLGALMGGAGGYLKGGGQIPGLGSFDQQLPSDVYGPGRQGTGLLGGAQDLFGKANTGLTIGGQPMKLGSLLNAGGDIYGYMQGKDDIDDISKLYEQAERQASAQLNPYAQAGQGALQNLQAPSQEALQNDPGYQFRLQQGNQALERSLAAQGMGQSGAAMKAAQEYGQGLADQTYNDFYNRQMGLVNQGSNAASGLGTIIGQGAQGQAAARLAQINNRNQSLSNILGGGFDDDGNILEGSLSRLLGGMF